MTMENNKLIAEFMGGYTPYERFGDSTEYYYKGHYVTLENMKFQTSWDWLMPVIKKINEQIDPNVKGLWRMITHPYDYHVGDVFSQVVEFIINIKN